ncbi:MAG: divergent polysaccharide deacetylase family protein [Rhizobium sp.]|nr:divergent polysaccharide deacetylase family protein [Rhizobium sp.]
MDLHGPLGLKRTGGGRRKRFLRLSSLSPALAVLVLSGISVWTALSPLHLRPDPPVSLTAAPPELGIATATDAGAAIPAEQTGIKVSGPQDGANVRRTTTPDGNVVTTFSPTGRQGPVIIGATTTQDPRLAGQPNEDLIERTGDGDLPTVSASGLRPFDFYARPWSGARATRIAIVVGGIGLSQTGSQTAIRELPEDITLAFAATGNSLQRWMQAARRTGHEILLQVPFEPFDYPDNNPGPHTLRVGLDAKKNLSELHTSLAQITNYTGIMNFLGGRFLSDADALEPVMRDIGRRGLLFLDDATSAQTLTGTLAGTIGVPHGFADMVVDDQIDRTAILKKLDELERVARRNGGAIGVASAFDESVAAISQWMDEASTRGIEFVGVSALVKDPQQQ